MLRNGLMDYGRSYEFRIEGLLSWLLLLALVNSAYVFICFFQIIPSYEQIDIILACIDVLMFSLILFVFLYFIAVINDHFNLHQTIIKNNKAIFCDLLRMKDFYFSSEFSSKNLLYVQLISKIKQNSGNDPKAIKRFLQNLIFSYEDIIEILQEEQKNHPYRLLGITIT